MGGAGISQLQTNYILMNIAHIAIWTHDLERLKDFYCRFLGGMAGLKYYNSKTLFTSYFISFEDGCRLEIMHKPGIPGNKNDVIEAQHTGLIHIAFEVRSRKIVDAKVIELQENGFPILKGPRVTGDGYYEFETLDPDGNRIEITTMAE
jgi:lactoylglutathione lyase